MKKKFSILLIFTFIFISNSLIVFADVNSAEPVFEAVHENTGYEEKHEEPTQEEKEEGREPLA